MGFKKAGAKPAQAAAPATTTLDVAGILAALQANPQLLAQIQGQATQPAKAGKVGRPKKAAGPVADSVRIEEGNTAKHVNVFFYLESSGESCKPNDETLKLLKANGFRFTLGEGNPHFWGFRQMLPEELA